MQGLISNLIRPFRFRYSLFDLGPKFTDKYDREDSSLLNDRGFRIQYSYYKNKKSSDTCVIYAHCNSGCRIQGLQFVQPVMDAGWNLCLFDFAGSGISEGQYISLGYYQCMDLQTIVSLILKQGNNKIHLWGRSMGAATIILYLSQTKQIDTIVSCVLDSPYSSLWKVVRQFGKSKTKIPQFIIQHVMQYIRKIIIKDHQFDIKQLQLLKKIQNIEIPIMFIASTHDSFVDCNHATELYKWSVSKQKILEYIEQQHNSPRQNHIFKIGLNFMNKSLIQKNNIQKQIKILSKKKELCRKMTGHNMAQLITKPVKKNSKNQSCSTGNLTKLSNLYLNNIKIIKKSQKYNQPNPQKQPYQKYHNKNPHIIQQSMIKLNPQINQLIQPKHIKNNKDIKHEQQKISITLNRKKQKTNNIHKLSLQKIIKNDKQNNINGSNKNKKQLQNNNKFFEGIEELGYVGNKFNLQDINLSNTIKFQDKDDFQEKKKKTQKLNIYMRKNQNSLSKQTKPTGIKITNKIIQNTRKQKSTNVSPKLPPQFQQKNHRERIKTQMISVFEEDDEYQINKNNIYDNKIQINNNKKQQNSIYSDISMQQKQKDEKKWVCGMEDMCKFQAIDHYSKQILCNKYRDSQVYRNDNNRKYNHQISCNDVWMGKNKGYDMSPVMLKSQLKHFQSIGDLPSSISAYNDNKKRGGYIRNHEMSVTQKIIKIQLDRNLFQKTTQNQQLLKSQNIKLDLLQTNYQKNKNQSLTLEQTQKVQVSRQNANFQDNPILLKFKLKNKRIFKTNSQCSNTLMF